MSDVRSVLVEVYVQSPCCLCLMLHQTFQTQVGLRKYKNDKHVCGKFVVIGNVQQSDCIVVTMYALATINSIRSLGSEFVNPVLLSFS